MLNKANLYKLFESLLPFLFPRLRRISSVPLEQKKFIQPSERSKSKLMLVEHNISDVSTASRKSFYGSTSLTTLIYVSY